MSQVTEVDVNIFETYSVCRVTNYVEALLPDKLKKFPQVSTLFKCLSSSTVSAQFEIWDHLILTLLVTLQLKIFKTKTIK